MRCCASFEGATRVAADEAERYLEQHPALATNGKTDVLLIPLPASSGGQPGQRGAAFLEHDALVGRVAAAVAKATGGNYVALLTGKAGGADDVQHLTMRRRLAEAEPQANPNPNFDPNPNPNPNTNPNPNPNQP